MSDLPKHVEIHEEGPREGFQIEPGPISTERKIALVDALSETGLKRIQIASFVNPKRVPGWADAEAVVSPKPGRLVIFDGSILHAGRPPNRSCYAPRYTLAYKLEPTA